MKRLPLLLAVLLTQPLFAQLPGVGLDALPSANPLGGGELLFGYQAGSGGSGATACARGWCPVSVTPLLLKNYIVGAGGVLSSVGFSTTASWLTVGNSPLVANGTITLTPTTGLTANEVVATPNGIAGAVGLRALVGADIPAINLAGSGNGGVNGLLGIGNGGIGASSFISAGLATFSGPITSGHCTQFSTTTGNIVDSGAGCGSGSSSAFSSLTSSTNTTAAMVVGTGASLTTTGTGSINANEVNGGTISANVSVLGTNGSSQPVAASTTGSGIVVLATAPTITTPNLGTPSTLVLTNATGLPNASVIGLGTFATQSYATPPAIGGTTPAAGAFTTLSATTPITGTSGGTGVNNGSNTITLASTLTTSGANPLTLTTTGTTNATLPAGTVSLGYLNLPLANSGSTLTTGTYAFVLADQGKQIEVNCASACTATIPANASVAYPIGTILVFHNLCGAASNLNITITSDTLYLAVTQTTSAHVMGVCAQSYAIKETTTTWKLSGEGIISRVFNAQAQNDDAYAMAA